MPALTPANLQFAKLLEALKFLMYDHFKLPQKIFRYTGADSNRDVFELASKSELDDITTETHHRGIPTLVFSKVGFYASEAKKS